MSPQDLPSVHEVLQELGGEPNLGPHGQAVQAIREVLEAQRKALLAGEMPGESVVEAVRASLAQSRRRSLRRVINATGVVLHTNLGRAPLGPVEGTEGYSNLEYDLATGKRGKRDVHTGTLLEAILGKPAIVVNNGAAALFLTLNELAAGGEAIVSRGELIEIGDGFRIPEIMERSGTRLREVGTTNRTNIRDYRNAISEHTKVLLRVHPSNFRMSGFTARPEVSELVALSRETGIPFYEDLGSGCLTELRAFGIDEPLAQNSLKAGVNVISFSGDKLLGGPQAGIIAGDAELVARVRRNPLFRAFRQDKLFYTAMETTLRHILLEEFDAIPALRMIRMPAEAIRTRAEALAAQTGGNVEAGESVIGGGSTPDLALPTWLVVITNKEAAGLERRLRANRIPIIARIERDRVLLDLRTVFPEEEAEIIYALSE